MRRFLVVGCGGSGGATLALMMDQLRSELHTAGIETHHATRVIPRLTAESCEHLRNGRRRNADRARSQRRCREIRHVVSSQSADA